MKKYFNIFQLAVLLFGLSLLAACGDDNDNGIDTDVENGEGPSADDTAVIPASAEFLGDSIQQTRTLLLSDNPINKVTVSKTQNGHIALLGGYKDKSAVYIYAKADQGELSKAEVALLLSKYYDVAIDVNKAEIKVNISEKGGIVHDADYKKLRVSVKIFTPSKVSSVLQIDEGSIFTSGMLGGEHVSLSTSGTIKFLNSTGKRFGAKSTFGYIGVINTSASESIDTNLERGSIQLKIAKTTKATLSLQSLTNIVANILNNTNFSGSKTRTSVNGNLNGGGYSINASVGTGSINLDWYNDN